jgi:malate dehydrogenase
VDVAVLGATGDVGRQVCTQLVERALLPTTSRLQLVGRAGGASARATHGLRADLIDAYDEHAPILDVALDPADVVADVVVLAAGRTQQPNGESFARSELAADNAAIFHAYADALAEHGSGSEVVIVVTNPVELGVAILAARLGRERVIGMGAWLDTLRFRREVAVSLGVRRHRVGGFVGGEHGPGAVPLWSTVRVGGLDAWERERAVARVRGARSLDDFPAEVAAAQAHLAELDTADGYRFVDTLPPDLRVVLRPHLTQRSGAKTAAGTASATIDLVETILDGRDIVVAGQVALEGEVTLAGEPVHGVLGVPVQLGPEGWTRVLLEHPASDEERALAGVAASVAAGVAPWTGPRDAGA